MKKKILLFIIICTQVVSNYTFAQQPEKHAICGNTGPDEKWEQWFQSKISEFKNSPESRSNSIITIPVVVHILYKTGQAVGKTPNITAEQVKSQIDFLNKMMDGSDPNKSKLPAPFKSVDAGNTNIQFCLAVKGPDGSTLAEPGIDRINLNDKGWDDPSTFTTLDQIMNLYDNTVKPASIWDPTKYCNIWTGDFTNKSYYLGYATFPVGTGLTGITSNLATATTDGVVMGSNVFGCKALYANGYYFTEPYIYGVTSAHEIGHWLGLRHIGGDQSCGDDYCKDTPPQKGGFNNGPSGQNWGCPTYPFQVNGCGSGVSPNGEMFQNYMDYSDDQCRSLFTADQKIRIQTTMANGARRKTLGTHGLCDITSPALAEFTSDKTNGCGTLTVQFTDQSSNAPTSWKWDFGDGSVVSTLQNPSHTYASIGNFNVTLTAENAYGGTPVTKNQYITISAGVPYTAVKGGPVNNTDVGAGGNFNGNDSRGLLFNVLTPVNIESFKVYATGAGERTIELLDGVNGTSLQTKTVNIPDGESRVPLNFSVNTGSQYFIKITGTNINLYRNNAGAVFPYKIADLIEITQTDYAATNPNYYYYFYDWEVKKQGCDVSTGIVDSDGGAAIQIHPNPSKGNVIIEFPPSSINLSVCIYNVIGEQVYGKEIISSNQVFTIDLSNQPNGMYFITIGTGNRSTTKKLVLTK